MPVNAPSTSNPHAAPPAVPQVATAGATSSAGGPSTVIASTSGSSSAVPAGPATALAARAAIQQLAATLQTRETELRQLETEIAALRQNPAQAAQLARRSELLKDSALLRSREDNESLRLDDATTDCERQQQQVDQLRNKIARKTEGVEALQKQMAELLSTRGGRGGRGGSGTPGTSAPLAAGRTSSEAASSKASSSRALPSEAASSKAADPRQTQLDACLREQQTVNQRIAALRSESAQLRGMAEQVQQKQRESESQRQRMNDPERVDSARSRGSYLEGVTHLCAQLGLNPPTTPEARRHFFDAVLERFAQRLPQGNSTRLQIKEDIQSQKAGTLMTISALLAYLHPEKSDTTLQEGISSATLNLINRYPTMDAFGAHAQEVAHIISEAAEVTISYVNGKVQEQLRDLREHANDSNYKFLGTKLRQREIAPQRERQRAVLELILRNRQTLKNELRDTILDWCGRELEMASQQQDSRQLTEIAVTSIEADQLKIAIELSVAEARRDKLRDQITELQREQADSASEAGTSASHAAVAVTSNFATASGTQVRAPETRLSATKGELAQLNDKLATALASLQAAQAERQTAQTVLEQTRVRLTQNQQELAQLEGEMAQGSAALGELLTRQNRARQGLKAEIEQMKKDPALTRLISPEALERVLKRHLDKRDGELQERAYEHGRAGTYASFRTLLNVINEVHQDACARFSDLMQAPHASAFQQARQQCELRGEVPVDVELTHGERVGWALHAGMPQSNTRIETSTSAYSIDWQAGTGPVISHLFPSTRDR